MSMLGKALRSLRDLSLVPTRELIAALDSLVGPMTEEQKRQSLRLGLSSPLVAWGELSGGHGRFLLHFNIESSDGSRMHGAAVGSDLARVAHQAAARMRNWLAPSPETLPPERDEFAHQAFMRALAKVADSRLCEAERLLEVAHDSCSGVPHFARTYARVQALLGRPHGLAEVQALEEQALRDDDRHSLALGQFLRSILHEQHGHLTLAVAASRKAIALAESAGLGDELVEFMIHCAIQLGECFDDGAEPMLSRGVARAEGLGNRALLLRAYVAAGLLAGLRSDVLSCLAHTESAIAVVPRVESSLHSMPYVQLGWSQLQLGQLDRAMESTRVALGHAEVGGRQPELGIAAAVAARACLDSRRIHEAIALNARLQAHVEDNSLAMRYAREVVLKASFLRVAGCFDAAMDSIAGVRSAARHHPVIEALCDRARLHVLLKARRYDELGHTCQALMESAPRDPRLLLSIQHARAFHDYQAEGNVDAALARMHEAMRSTPVCEVNARISLDAAWIHLERGEVTHARACTEHLQGWLEQSPEGRMVDARLRYASGDTAGAAAVQRRFCRQHAETLTHFHQHLAKAYELRLQGGQDLSIPPLAEPLCLHWALQPRVLAELPRELTALCK
jgi:tetratricopeptide (TPR) repeat protein